MMPFQAMALRKQAVGSAQSFWLRTVDANGATTFTDSGPFARTITRTGSPVASSTVTYSGDNSIRFAGSGALHVANFGGFDFGVADFRVRFSFRVDSTGSQNQLIDMTDASHTTHPILYTLSGTVRYYQGGGDRITSGAVVAANTDVTVDFKRVSNVYTLIVNGSTIGTYSPGAQTFSGAGIHIGANYVDAAPMTGYMGQVIVDKG